MCGIAGVIAKPGCVASSQVEILSDKLSHRGPDDCGLVTLKDRQNTSEIHLIHRRLAIIDLSSHAHQPMKDAVTGNYITFNGEIYNYCELRNKLKAKGYVFQSQSDTEVILAGYRFFGRKILNMLRGMYAIAIWDEKKQKMVLALDPFGIKPLYYYCSKNVFSFSSEINALIESRIIDKSIDEKAVKSYLAFGAVQSPKTMIKDVRALLPGQYMEYDLLTKKFAIGSYSDFASPSENTSSINSKEEHALEFRRLFKQSLLRHIVSDVPVGLFLSGGIDSSAIAILAHEMELDLKTFSVTFKEKEYSEATFSRHLAKTLQLNHQEIHVDENQLLGQLDSILSAMDQPSVDGINTYMISKAVRESGIKTVLSGQGADEVLAGYNTFKYLPVAKRWLSPLHGTIRNLASEFLTGPIRFMPVKIKALDMIRAGGDLTELYLCARELSDLGTLHQISRNQHKYMKNFIDDSLLKKIILESESRDIIGQISILELRMYLANTLLRDSDVMSMTHGLEIRVPYLDCDLARYVLGLPKEKKIDSRAPKPLLINAMQGAMPKEIYMRKKMGFTFPWEIWMKNDLKDRITDAFSDKEAGRVLDIDLQELRLLWRSYQEGRKRLNWSFFWSLYVILFWVRKRILD